MLSKEPWSLHLIGWVFAIGLLTALINGEDMMKYYHVQNLVNQGVAAQGTVTRMQWKRIRVSKTTRRTVYYPIISYKTNNNEQTEFQDLLSTEESSTYPVGAVVNILFDKNDPKNAMIEQDRLLIEKTHDRVFLSLGVIIACLFAFIYSLYTYLKIKKPEDEPKL